MEEDFRLIDNYLMIRMPTEIDHHKSVNISTKADRYILSKKVENVVFDFERTTFMDSSGLGLILGRYTKAEEVGTAFAVQGAHGRVRQMFDMAGLDRIITFEGDVKK